MTTQRAAAAAAAAAAKKRAPGNATNKRASAATVKKKNTRRVEPKRSNRKRPADDDRVRVETPVPIDVREVIEAPSHPLAMLTVSPRPTLGVKVKTSVHRTSDRRIDTYKSARLRTVTLAQRLYIL